MSPELAGEFPSSAEEREDDPEELGEDNPDLTAELADSEGDDEELDAIIEAGHEDEDEEEEELDARPPFCPPLTSVQLLLDVEPEPPLFTGIRETASVQAKPPPMTAPKPRKKRPANSQQNPGTKRAGSSSAYLGVSYNKHNRRWTAQGSLGGGVHMPAGAGALRSRSARDSAQGVTGREADA